MKTINKLVLMVTILLSATIGACGAPIKNAKTETFTVYGKCGMCKTRIEKAAYKKGVSKGVWNADTKILSLTYDATKTSADEVLKKIAYAGHDNDRFLAPDAAYANLPDCCHYDRKKVETAAIKTDSVKVEVAAIDTAKKTIQAVNPLSEVYAAYFGLKDALTKDDGTTASVKANELFLAIGKADMGRMSQDQHAVWMKYMDALSNDAQKIAGIKVVEQQRTLFISLSKNMYEVMKVFKMDVPVYYDFCPMANNGKGANWLSLDKKISNPYFGKQMLTCGSVQETIVK